MDFKCHSKRAEFPRLAIILYNL